jgi:hypothetical protein
VGPTDCRESNVSSDDADSATWRHLATMVGVLVAVAIVIYFAASSVAD